MSLFDLPQRCGRVILASGSPRRIQLLREAGLDPVVAAQDVDETPLPKETAAALVERLARLKATSALASVRNLDDDAIVIAADTTVAIDGLELGKPANDADARSMLRRLSGRSHQVHTGVCVARPARKEGDRPIMRTFVDTTDVEFYELADADIDAYVASGEPADKAGSYGIQGLGRALVRKIDGDYFNVVGLPVARLLRELDTLVSEG